MGEKRSVICVKVVVEGKRRDQSTDRWKSIRLRTEPWGTPQDEV